MPSSSILEASITHPFSYPAMSLERSTIKGEEQELSDSSSLRMRKSDQHEQREAVHVNTAIVPLFSPPNRHEYLYPQSTTFDGADLRQHSSSPPTITMSTEGRLPSPSQQPAANRMSLSTLCSPPSSTLPPHMARGTYDPSTAHLARSPSSVASGLSSPPYTNASLSLAGSSVPPRSPSITVLDRSHPDDRSASPVSHLHVHHPHQQPLSAPFVTTTPPPLPLGPLHSNQADSPSSSTGAGKRKRASPMANDSQQPPQGWQQGAEFDERTKTWKHATGFRRDLTADKLTQPDAPTRKKRQSSVYRSTSAVSPRATSMGAALPYQRARRGSTASHHSGSGDSISYGKQHDRDDGDSDNEDELGFEAATSVPATIGGAAGGLGVTFDSVIPGTTTSSSSRKSGPAANKKRKANVPTPIAAVAVSEHSPSPSSPLPNMAGLDADEVARLEKKRRQNTQAARRSRIRKAEEVQKLQTLLTTRDSEVSELERQVSEMRRDRERLDAMLREEVEMSGVLKNVICEIVGEHKGGEFIAGAVQRWKAIVAPAAPSTTAAKASMGVTKDVEMDDYDDEKSGSGSGS